MLAQQTQTNGKKSSSSSVVTTPASTPVTNGNVQSTPPPPNNNAPKYGTLVPNRIFVGGISANTTEGELMQLFSNYGTVKAAKIIQDRAGVSRGYGFITFESEDDAKRPLKDADNIVLRERKLNIAPAIKKQPFNRAFDASSPPAVAPGTPAQYFYPPSPGMPYFQGGVAYYPQPGPPAPGDPTTQQATVFQAPPVYPPQSGPPQAPTYPSMMFPQTIYMPQQYPMPMPYDYNYYPGNGGGQYMVSGQSNNGGSGSSGGGGGSTTNSNASSNGPQNNGGGGGNSMPPAHSPPRPCYNAQLHYGPPDGGAAVAAAAAAMFYNVPMYGGPIETGPPMFATEMDMSNGPYQEVSHTPTLNDYMQQQQPQQRPQSGDFIHHYNPFVRHVVSSPHPGDISSNNTDLVDQDDTSGRQSKTPVVSLLSMEQHQEKDYVSMQGGRRVKPPTPVVPQQFAMQHPHQQQQTSHHAIYHTVHYSNSNYNGITNHRSTPPMTNNTRSQIQYKTVTSTNNNNNYKDNFNNGWRRNVRNATYNNNNNNNVRNFRYNNNNNNEIYSSRSSLRTDSNSSAAAAPQDCEQHSNKNDIVLVPLPPPPPPPPANNMYATYNGRGYHGVKRGPSFVQDRKNNFLCVQQMRNGGQHQQQQQQQQMAQQSLASAGNFMVPQVRRNKRTTTRRQVTVGGGSGGAAVALSEIGAGDAPLPAPSGGDVGEACKKMEALKLG